MNLTPNKKKIHMYIANEEVVCSNQINIVEELTNVNTVVLKNCYPLAWEQTKDYTQFYFPKDYSLFKLVYDYTDYNLTTENNQDLLTESSEEISVGNTQVVAFAGVVKRSNAINLNPVYPHFSDLQVLDFKTFLSEGDVFNFVIDSMTIGQAINYVINQYSGYNFIVGRLNLGSKLNDIVNNYNCDQKTLYDVLEYFAQITNSVWTTRYISDIEIAIDFYDMNSLTQKPDLVYDTDFFNENSIKSITYSLNSNDYRNKQIMTSNGIAGNILITQQFVITGQEYYLDEKISNIVNATLNGQRLVCATNVDEENGQTADLFYEVGSNEIKLDDQALPGSILIVQYYPQVAGRQMIINPDEVNRISEQLSNVGIIARYENRQDADTSAELSAIAQTYMQFKGKPDITLTVETVNNDLFNVGNIVHFNNNEVDQLQDLVDNYAVVKKTSTIYQNNADSTNYVIYTYKLNNNFNFENYINYFNNQRAKIIGNIKEGEFINRYVENIQNYNIIFNPPVIVGGV
jgi:hypothetical protein